MFVMHHYIKGIDDDLLPDWFKKHVRPILKRYKCDCRFESFNHFEHSAVTLSVKDDIFRIIPFIVKRMSKNGIICEISILIEIEPDVLPGQSYIAKTLQIVV